MAPSLLSRLMSPPRRLRQGRLLQHVAGIRFSDQGSGISLQQKAGRGRIGGGLVKAHMFDGRMRVQRPHDGHESIFTLAGVRALDPHAPVRRPK